MRREVERNSIPYGEDQVWARATSSMRATQITYHRGNTTTDYGEQTYKRQGCTVFGTLGRDRNIAHRTAENNTNMETYGIHALQRKEVRKANIIENYRGYRMDGGPEMEQVKHNEKV
jgi:hypothetical protein